MQYLPRILFITKKRLDSYGVSYGLLNSAQFNANAFNHIGIESKVVQVVDNNCIDREVRAYRPTHVIIEALWIVPDKFNVLLPLYPSVIWNVRVHSQVPFLANEGIAVEWIYEYMKIAEKYNNFNLSFNNLNMHHEMTKLGIKNDYLPNIYCPNYEDRISVQKKNSEYIDIGCFGSVRPMKNHLIQAIAAIIFANNINKKLRFHVNSNRIEQNGERAYNNLRNIFKYSKHQLVEHDWMPHKEFLEVVEQMDLGLQVSLSETFNIVAADFVHCGIPIVTSSQIDWMPFWTKANPNEAQSIVNCLILAYYGKKIGLQKINKYKLQKYSSDSTEEWVKYLEKF